jgi:hypothetical protein
MNFEENHSYGGDFVEYRLFVVDADRRPSVERLQALLANVNALIADTCLSHLWQRDVFRLSIIIEQSSETSASSDKRQAASSGSGALASSSTTIPAHLAGRSYVGDNMEDEWFIVYILRQISRHFTELAIAMSDADGEFLLIEAAQHLPTWLDPDNSGNRMWLFKGRWCLLDQQAGGTSLSLSAALTCLWQSDGAAIRVAPPIAAALDERVDVHPQRAHSDTRHMVRCRVTRDVAVLLGALPQLLAPAVDAFYTREPADLKACDAMARFGQQPLVDVRVRFTRCLYAQLVRQQYHAPRRAPFVVPSDERHVDYAAARLGMLVTCGFEMLAARGAAGDATRLRSTTGAWPLPPAAAAAWHRLAADRAADHALSACLWPVYDPDDADALLSLCNLVCERATAAQQDADDDGDVVLFEPTSATQADDSDAWLHVSPTDVDSVLQSRFDNLDDVDLAISDDEADSNNDDDDDDSDDDEDDDNDNNDKKDDNSELFDAKRFGKLINTMERFVAHESDIDGVVAPSDAAVEFDENKFFKVMHDALQRVANGEQLSDDEGTSIALNNRFFSSHCVCRSN